MLINAELDSKEKVLLPKAFLRWYIPNDYQKPLTVLERKEINCTKLNIIPVSVLEFKCINAMKKILKQMLADTNQRKSSGQETQGEEQEPMSIRERKKSNEFINL